jgi:hypothetical protein
MRIAAADKLFEEVLEPRVKRPIPRGEALLVDLEEFLVVVADDFLEGIGGAAWAVAFLRRRGGGHEGAPGRSLSDLGRLAIRHPAEAFRILPNSTRGRYRYRYRFQRPITRSDCRNQRSVGRHRLVRSVTSRSRKGHSCSAFDPDPDTDPDLIRSACRTSEPGARTHKSVLRQGSGLFRARC